MHFTYRNDVNDDLIQGDILNRTHEIERILTDVHPYYAKNPANKYFIVLTQSCDLVRRRNKDPCTVRYISLAPVRPLSLVIERQIQGITDKDITTEDLPVCSLRQKNQLQQFLARLLNNNDPDYFYLHKEPTLAFPDSCCAFLRLSIAIKAKEHYSTCLDARVLRLEENFRAKLGWLVGNLYSRVGTKDWPEHEINSLITDRLKDAALWVDDAHLKKLKEFTRHWLLENPDRTLDAEVLEQLLSAIKPRKQEVIERISTLLSEAPRIKQLLNAQHLSPEDIRRVTKRFEDDAQLTALLRKD